MTMLAGGTTKFKMELKKSIPKKNFSSRNGRGRDCFRLGRRNERNAERMKEMEEIRKENFGFGREVLADQHHDYMHEGCEHTCWSQAHVVTDGRVFWIFLHEFR